MSADFQVLLARHPQVEGGQGLCYGRRDLALAPGWQDHVALWPPISPVQDGARLFSSPATRCRLAAQAYATRLLAAQPQAGRDTAGRNPSGDAGAVTIDARLAEIDFGHWEGRDWSDIERVELDEWAADPMGYRPGGGESVDALIARVTAFWQERLNARETCCVITHGGPLRVLLALAEGRQFCMEDPAPAQGRAILLHFSNNHGRFVASVPPIR